MARDQRTREYVSRRTAEGKSKREIMRCLKRYVAREIYAHLCRPPREEVPARRPLDVYRSIIRDTGHREHASAGRPSDGSEPRARARYLATPATRPDEPRARIRSC